MAPRSAEAECSTRCTGARRSDRFLSGLQSADRVIFISHIHPDPDSIGSMWGLAHLVTHRLGKEVLLTRDGPILRAENRAMVDVLKIHLTPLDTVAWRSGDAIVMVDSQPNTGRHSLAADMPIYAVIDHHATSGETSQASFVDIRTSLGATCTLVTRYLTEQQVPIPERLATALLYGIETEITGYPREAGPADDEALLLLYPLADKDDLARIRNAPLPPSYYGCLLQALQCTFRYDRLIISWVNDMPHPEHAAEIADFMIRLEEVDWAVCVGLCRDKLVLSVRAKREDAQAGQLLQAVVGKLGRAGGHDRRAGGCIPLPNATVAAVEEIQAELRRRFLKALKIEETRGQRLIPRRQILNHIQD